MEKVLFLLGAYKPLPSANGICVDAIIQHLLSEGKKVYCIAYLKPGLLREEIIDSVKIRRIREPLYLYLYDKSKKEKSIVSSFVLREISKAIDVIKLFSKKKTFPISSQRLVRSFYEMAESIIEENSIDTIIAVNMPIETIKAVALIKKKKHTIRSVAYLLDPINGGVHHKLLRQEETKRTRDFENNYLRMMDVVICQKEHERHFRSQFNERELKAFYFLGVPLLQNKIKNSSNQIKKTNYIAIYAGGIDRKTRNPEYIINVFKHVKNVTLHMYITNDPSCAIEAVGENANIVIHGRISHDELEQRLEEADCFISIGNSQTMQAPSKLIEYMSYGKPIISTFRIENDTSREYMEKYPLGVMLDEHDLDFERQAKAIEGFLASHHDEVTYEMISSFFWQNTPRAFLDAVEEKNNEYKIDRN